MQSDSANIFLMAVIAGSSEGTVKSDAATYLHSDSGDECNDPRKAFGK